ncbi:MAG: LysR family transcriptional regulator [Lachnospiraceae bacterium]|nr:LysR family transcriptional regulator [Lachnospiraceae bacterium]
MNLLYLKYAVEVAASGSINKAAEKLYIDQPNLSRAIKDLEYSLGVAIFERSSRGMKLTPEGERFLEYANKILKQVDAVENMFRTDGANKLHFSISAPRASYISEAFSNFAAQIGKEAGMEMFYRETNAMRAVKNILEENYRLGIVRYAGQYDKYYKEMFETKGLASELVAEFSYVLIMNRKSPLANLSEIKFSDLKDLIEIAHADPYVPSMPLSEVKKEELPDIERRIFVFERASEFELLSKDPYAFMWVSDTPKEMLERYGLVTRRCVDNKKIYKDMMIYKKDYKFTDIDKRFITELCEVKRHLFGN